MLGRSSVWPHLSYICSRIRRKCVQSIKPCSNIDSICLGLLKASAAVGKYRFNRIARPAQLRMWFSVSHSVALRRSIMKLLALDILHWQKKRRNTRQILRLIIDNLSTDCRQSVAFSSTYSVMVS